MAAGQRLKYLKMAIAYAPEREKAVYTAEFAAITGYAEKRKRKDIRAAVSVGALAMIIAAVSSGLSLNNFYGGRFFQTPANTLIALTIPYALSVTGMSLYVKAKNNGNTTTAGLVMSLLALIISNISVVGAIIRFFIK